MTTYLSPIVSCIHCKRIKSAKGIFSHYLVAHTQEGKEKLDKAREKSITPASSAKAKKVKDKQIAYELSPSKCKCCNTNLPFNIRNNKFCNTSCAAIFNNNARTESGWMHSDSTIAKMQANFYPNSRIKFCVCEYCNIRYTWNNIQSKSKRFCSIKCSAKSKFDKMSANAKERGLGGVRQSKKILYNGVHLGSTYELTVAKSLDENLIKWTVPNKIPYADPNGKLRTYRADFYLPEYDLYLDPKNDFLINNVNPALGFTDIEKIKCVMDQNNIKIFILDKNHLSWGSIKILLNGNS